MILEQLLEKENEVFKGNYQKYLSRIFHYIKYNLNEEKSCDNIYVRERHLKYIIYVNEPIDSGYEMGIKNYLKTLQKDGYIKFVKIEEQWYIKILKKYAGDNIEEFYIKCYKEINDKNKKSTFE